MVEDLMELFIDDFSVVGDTFEWCLTPRSYPKMCKHNHGPKSGKILIHGYGWYRSWSQSVTKGDGGW